MLHLPSNGPTLLSLINYTKNFPINDLPGFTYIISLDYQCIHISDSLAHLLSGLFEDNKINYREVPCYAPDQTLWLSQQSTIQSTEIKILNCSYLDKWRFFLGSKKTILQENNLIGILTNFIEVTDSGIIDLGRFLLNKKQDIATKQINFTIQPMQTPFKLTQREQECLFYLLRGSNYANIARKLNVALTTIQTHIEHIKEKFSVYTKSQMIEKSIALGYMTFIPKSLLDLNHYL